MAGRRDGGMAVREVTVKGCPIALMAVGEVTVKYCPIALMAVGEVVDKEPIFPTPWCN